jgi:hypothetical protein
VDEVAWRIDAWDSLAGRAFLCRRPADEQRAPDLDQSTVFVGPPFFQPEPLASRAPGFAACRGTFQAGLFVDGEEVAFETLADAIEFVRRGYTSGREFPDPTAPLGAPRRPIEGEGGGGAAAFEWPEQELLPDGRYLDDAISSLVVQFDKTIQEVHRVGASKPCQWKFADNEALTLGIGDILRFAGEALLRELTERLPVSSSVDDCVVWVEATQRLVRLLARLGVWPDLNWLVFHIFQDADSRFRERAADFAKRLDLLPPDLEEPMLFHHLFRRFDRWEVNEAEASDPYDDMSVLPLPRAIADKYRIGSSDPSLLTALSAWFGHVADGHDSGTLDRALLIFAAACAVVGPLRRQNEAYGGRWLIENRTIREHFHQRLGRDVWDWISAQLPDRAFNRRLENLLRSIPRIWMKASLPPTSTPQSFDPEPIDDITHDEREQLVMELGEVLLDDEELPVDSDFEDVSSLFEGAQAPAAEQAYEAEARHEAEHPPNARQAGA